VEKSNLKYSGEVRVASAVKKLYQLRPKVTASSVSVTSRIFNSKHKSCVPRLVRNCISCIERYGCTKSPTIGSFLHSFIVLYFIHNYIHTYTIVELYRQHICYIILRSNVYTLLKNLVGEEDRHIMFLISPISSYYYDLMKTLSPQGVLMQ
jgi:hypothetical protein